MADKKRKVKGKVVPVHAMKAYKGNGGTDLLILKPGSGWRQVVSLTLKPLYPYRKTPVPNAQNARWGPSQSGCFWRRENLLPGFKP